MRFILFCVAFFFGLTIAATGFIYNSTPVIIAGLIYFIVAGLIWPDKPDE